jgi:uncharacterized protein (DUF302 family)
MLTLLATLVLAPPPATQAPDTLVRTRSSHPVAETVTRLRTAAESRGLTIFAVVDHAANARQADLDLPPTTLVILGNPRAGTLLMHCDPAVAVELPLRMLVWEDSEARTWIGHQPVSLLRMRYRLEACGEVLERIEGVLEVLRREAAGAGGGDW